MSRKTEGNLKHASRMELLELLLKEKQRNAVLMQELAQEEEDPARRSAGMEDPMEELEAELKRIRYKKRYRSVLRSTIYILIVVAAVSILISVLLLPVFRINGSSMNPGLTDGDIVVSVKSRDYKSGDIVAFYYNNRIFVKRVIAVSGDWVNIDKDGTVYVNDEPLDEPYLTEKALGECNITLPYQVPDGRLFVMGDNRSVSIDSRSTTVGCVSDEQIAGKLLARVWPLNKLGLLK
jgi:signal peptidase I